MRLLDRFDYEGVDINSDFIKSCKKKYPQINFFVSNKPKKIVDYVVMSGTYNLATLNDVIFWEKYIFQNLVECFELCKTGLIFNMHVNNITIIRNKIFYTTEKRMTSLLSNITKNIRFYKSDHFKNERIFIISR